MADADTITVAFTKSALQQLADIETVIDDTNTWSTYIGIVSDDRLLETLELRDQHKLDTDFHHGHRDVETTLEEIHETMGTDRFILIAVGDAYEDVAEATDWEYQPLDEAATEADWELADGN